jgi:uncharacterized lipoprotein YddW (UPF0748 family)|tara:strand:- start:58640 stop:59764 length:1125 start_codon:yes stop_codon:yes gene_type:complete
LINQLQYRLRATVLVALLFICTSQIIAGFNAFEEKCLWVIRNTMTNKQSIDEMIHFAQSNGFNNLLVQIRGRGDAYYRTQLVPKSELLQNPDFDPLAYIIDEAHAVGLTVHAWVNVYLVWSSEKTPRALHHVYNGYPEWIDTNGNETISNKKNGIVGEGYFLAPHHPEVQKHLLAVFRELTALYNIDGLHLDYIRFQDTEYGNNVGAKTFYLQNRYNDKKHVFENDDYVEWDNYRRAAITNLVKETKQMLLDVRPDCILSAAVKPNLLLAKNRYFQEWDVWLAAGYLDWAIPMNYTSNLRDFANNIDIIYENLPRKYRHKIIMGIALYNQKPIEAVDKIYYSEITRFRGISIFSYNVFKENPRYTNDFIKSIRY